MPYGGLVYAAIPFVIGANPRYRPARRTAMRQKGRQCLMRSDGDADGRAMRKGAARRS